MKRTIVTAAAGVVLGIAGAAAPASAAEGPKGYETGDLTCGSTTYTVLATGFGAAFRVVDTTGVLVFHSGTLTNVATGESVTFGPTGNPQGRDEVRRTGVLTNPVYGSAFQVEFSMSVAPRWSAATGARARSLRRGNGGGRPRSRDRKRRRRGATALEQDPGGVAGEAGEAGGGQANGGERARSFEPDLRFRHDRGDRADDGDDRAEARAGSAGRRRAPRRLRAVSRGHRAGPRGTPPGSTRRPGHPPTPPRERRR